MNLSDSTDALAAQVAGRANRFGFQFLAQVAGLDLDHNVFFSPYSIAAALAMTLNGAAGATEQAMAETLALDGLTRAEINQGHAALLALLTAPAADGAILNSANSLWAAPAEPLRPDFVRRGHDYYAARLENIDFGSPEALGIINGWVESKTAGKIGDLVKAQDLIGAALILMNAVYFKGLWQAQFDEARTQTAPFHALDGDRPVPFMARSGTYAYYEDDACQAVSLPYRGNRLSMVVFLPRVEHARADYAPPGRSLAPFVAGLDAATWDGYLPRFRRAPVELLLPRFKLEAEAELSRVLKSMGMGLAFTDEADFRDMTAARPTSIGVVRHKAFVEVNEEGTEAAAATAVVMTRAVAARGPEPVVMRIDRPFFFAIRDEPTGLVLFMGCVYDPQ
jgi:serine protease inhibitor